MHKKHRKWTFGTIRETIEDFGIETRGEFSRKFPGAYRFALRNGFLGKLIPGDFRFGKTVRNRFVWTREACDSIAKGCSSVAEFRKECTGAYLKAVRSGWLKSYRWLSGTRKPRNFWTRERCFREAMNYRTPGGFFKGCPSAYVVSRRNGWTGDFFWFGSGKGSRGLKVDFSK